MKTIEEMTPKELRELADQKEREDYMKIYKTAELKHTLYEVDGGWLFEIKSKYQFTENDVDKIKKNLFSIALERGTKFYKYQDGWGDHKAGFIETAGDGWAEENLINIREYDPE